MTSRATSAAVQTREPGSVAPARVIAAAGQLGIVDILAGLGPERIRFDSDSKTLLRDVMRSDGATVSTSALGIWPDGVPVPEDLREAADWLYQRRVTPPPPAPGNHRLRVADLFSGWGGMSLGVAEACRALGIGFESAGAFDINPVAVGIYAKNLGLTNQKPIDLGTVLSKQVHRPPTRLEVALLKSIGRVDFVVAGPPCQGHSNLNNVTRRDDPKNELYLRVARFAKLVGPQHIVIENVPTVLADKRRVVFRTEEALTKLGYVVRKGLINAWEIGVPQSRKRHFLIASKKPIPDVKKIVERYRVVPRPLWWAIADLVDVRSTTAMDTPTIPKEVTRKRIKYLFDHDLHNLPDHKRPDCHRFKDHSYHAVYGRMYKDRLAPTMTGGFDTMGRGRFVHPTRQRTITPHEAARIQSIPDFIDFSGVPKRAQLTELIGNAVPPKLSYVIALELLR